MRVTILGCGGSAGVPHLGGADGRGDWGVCDPAEPRNRRMRTSLVVEGEDGRRLLVDTGPDMRAQLLEAGIGRVDAVLYTHAHADHVTGLDDVRLLNRSLGAPLDALGSAHTLAELGRRFDYAFRPWEGGGFFRPVMRPVPVSPGETTEAVGLTIRLFDQDHGRVRSLGLRIGGFGYSTDVVEIGPDGFAALAGVDTWVVSCFQRRPHPTHAGIDSVLAWAARVGARRTVLTHMGNDMDWAWLARNLPAGVEPASDGMVLDIG